jgi:glycosyltransferase involved in cell wall biosynthesis
MTASATVGGSMVKRAAEAFTRGEYTTALDLYEQLSRLLEADHFRANITICKRRIAALATGSPSSTSQLSRRGRAHTSAQICSSAEKQLKCLFYQQGKISETKQALDTLTVNGALLSPRQLEFQALVDGLTRLKLGWKFPPRQPNPGVSTRRGQILYCLHQAIPHTTNGYATRSHGVARGLQSRGWRVSVSTRPGFPWDSVCDDLPKHSFDLEYEGITYTATNGSHLNRTPLDYYLAEAADLYFRHAQICGAETIVAASNHITALPALTAARRLGVPFIYEMRGLWEETQASVQPEWSNSERYHLSHALERQVSTEADLVVTLTRELAEMVADWGVDRDRIVVVPNAVDETRFSPGPRDTALAENLDLVPGRTVIGYAGSAVAYEGLELLLDALALLKAKGTHFIFLLVGDGKCIDQVKARAKALGLAGDCRFVGRVPFDQVPRYLSCMDIMPVPRVSCAVTEIVSALKPLEAMAAGKAVVLSDVSPHKVLAGDQSRARLFSKDSSSDLARVLEDLVNDAGQRSRIGTAARQWIEGERTWDHVTASYSGALDRVRQHYGKVTAGISKARCLEDLTLGLIADRFTTDVISTAVRTVALSPNDWPEQLAKQTIDVLLIESAWKGNGGQWHRKVGHYSSEEFKPLRALIQHCRALGIPTLFWNKEDPVHFERFLPAARLCEHVFTTDSQRIIPYLAASGAATRSASSCPFFAAPKMHNLLPSKLPWQHTAAYGGTYYGDRYPERTEYIDKIMSAAAPLGLTIYDRQQTEVDSSYKYPSGLADYVAGGLDYEQMIEAYKAHPLQINVNSVLDSPTMFSRRVMEIAASGSAIVSGPALGLQNYLQNTVRVAHTETEAAEAMEALLRYPAYRWRVSLKAARTVMRAHTVQHRLVQMLRTAGMVVAAPSPPHITLYTREITSTAARCVAVQTLRPTRVLSVHWQPGTKEMLETLGIECEKADGQRTKAGELWAIAETHTLEELEAEDLEDLAWPTVYAPSSRFGFIRQAEPEANDWPGITVMDCHIECGLQIIRAGAELPIESFVDNCSLNSTLGLRKPPAEHEQVPKVQPVKTVVIAGHDLKFIKPFYPHFTKAGLRLLLDFWQSHHTHNERASQRLVAQADTIFCEWMLGNAIWYANHRREGQMLVGRLHLQEVEHALFRHIPFAKFNSVIFVAPHILRKSIRKTPALKNNGSVIYNGVDVATLQSVPRKPTNGKVLGFVGIVPRRKRFDLALDILRELRKNDTAYLLKVKGKRPDEYPWMANRPDEMRWYKHQFHRLEQDPLLRGAVIFDPHGNDMPEWYAGVDYVLSTSDFESFHFTIADGASAGCIPVVMPWEGAKELYPHDWVVGDVLSAVRRIRHTKRITHKNTSYTQMHFDLPIVANKLVNTILSSKLLR